MGTHLLLVLLILAFLSTTPSYAAASPHISAVISQSGLDYAKDLLVSRASATLTPLSVPDIERSVSIPVIGTVHMVASGIVLDGVAVANSTVAVGDSGVVVAASLSSVNLTMEWSYLYSAWVVTISDCGNASIHVEGMDVGISMEMKNQNGSLKLFVMECGCHVKDLDITLNGGASWFYQGFIDAFSNHIISSVENAITNKIMLGASKLDSFLGSLPKKIDVDNVTAMNVTFVNDPLFKSSSVEFDIDGLFIPSHKTALPGNRLFGDTKFTPPLVSSSKMLWISLDEDVFNSVSALYFKAGLLQRMVDKIPDQFLLNTATWRVFIPTLYHKYPDHDMVLNISAISPPSVRIDVGRIDATVDLDVTVNVLDFGEIVPVACISVSVAVSGAAVVSGNNLAGRVELDYFSFTLKWSEVGKLHTFIVQGGLPMYVATRGLYNLKPPTVFVPPCIRDDVEELLQIHRRMSQVDLKVELVALDLGETYEICNDLVARPFQTHHSIPSQGYVIYSVRRKLKKQYAHLKGNQIMKLKQSGAEITDTILYPEVAFTGDTKSDFILDPRNADALRAKVLITEATFLDDQIDVDHAQELGHMHLSEVNGSHIDTP